MDGELVAWALILAALVVWAVPRMDHDDRYRLKHNNRQRQIGDSE